MRQISNRQLFDIIEKRLVNDGSPRKIDHFAYFKTAEGRRKFVEEVIAEKFEVAEEMRAEEGASAAFPFGVHFQRIDAFQRDVIEGVTWKLEDLVAKYDGMYDGWGAMAGQRR
jgi:regulator of RNase E activity RraB